MPRTLSFMMRHSCAYDTGLFKGSLLRGFAVCCSACCSAKGIRDARLSAPSYVTCMHVHRCIYVYVYV